MILVALALAAFGPLTPDEAVARALERSALLEAHRHRIDEEEGPRTLGLLLENPQLRVAARHLERLGDPNATPADVLDGTSAGVRVSVPPVKAFGFAQRERAFHVDATRADLEDARRSLAARVRKLHAEILNLDARIALGEEEVALARRIQELVANRLAAELATRFDENVAALDLFDALAALESLRAARRIAVDELAAMLDLPPGEPLVLVEGARALCEEAGKLDVDTAVARAPELHALDARIAEEDAAKLAAWSSLVPWARFAQLDYRLGPTRADDRVQLRFGFTLPVLNFEQDEHRTRSARIARLSAERREIAGRIARDVRARQDDLEGQRALVTAYDETARPLVDRSIALVDESLALGEGDPVALARVSARALHARREALQARLRCEHAAIALGARTGTDPLLVPTTAPAP